MSIAPFQTTFSPPAPSAAAAVAASSVPPTAYNERVVAFLRQPNVIDVLRERRPAMMANKSIRDKILAVRHDGSAALERLSHDVELTILLSLFENEIMSYVPSPPPPLPPSTPSSAAHPSSPRSPNRTSSSPGPSIKTVSDEGGVP